MGVYKKFGVPNIVRHSRIPLYPYLRKSHLTDFLGFFVVGFRVQVGLWGSSRLLRGYAGATIDNDLGSRLALCKPHSISRVWLVWAPKLWTNLRNT